jgi:hypothetical protein
MPPFHRRSYRTNESGGSVLPQFDEEVELIVARDRPPHVANRLARKPQASASPTHQSPVDEYLYERVEALADHIRQLREELDTRVELQDYFLSQLDYQIRESAFSLSQFSPWGVGYNSGVDVKRNFLERQLPRLREERRATELKAWQDVTDIRKELREAENEYRAMTRHRRSFSTGDSGGD